VPQDEIFNKPTVRQVIFEARYPSLFFLESKIGELQLSLMRDFPTAELLFQQQLLFAHLGSDVRASESPPPNSTRPTEKIWRFQNQAKTITVNVQVSRLDVISTVHKTYRNSGSDQKFRDVLDRVVNAFLSLTALPRFQRLGLRYIDDCPLPDKSTHTFNEYYDAAYPAGRFSIEDTKAYDFIAVVHKEGVSLRYAESLADDNGKPKFTLDFDGFAENIEASKWLSITDRLHEVISNEYFKTIKEPVKAYMRNH